MGCPVPAVPKISESILGISEALNKSYDAELLLMKQYQSFYNEAEDKYSDCVTATFIIEFLQIQRTSVGEYGDLIARFNLGADILLFDKEMGKL